MMLPASGVVPWGISVRLLSASATPMTEWLSGGAVPGLNASRMVPAVSPGPARMPVLETTRISLMPAGILNGVAGLSASPSFRESRAIGAARWPPVCRIASSERTRLVVAHVDADHEVRREADEPGVLGLVGGAGLAGERLADFLQRGRGTGIDDTFQHRGDLVGGHGI